MGKRQLHGAIHYQCDWSGFAIAKTNCYLPTCKDGKLLKKGMYANWEAVIAHAYHIDKHGDENIPYFDLDYVLQFVQNLIGCLPNTAPHFSLLQHFKCTADGLTSAQFFDECFEQVHKVKAVKVYPGSNELSEITLTPTDGEINVKKQLQFMPYISYIQTHYFAIVPRQHNLSSLKRCKLGKDRHLIMYYYDIADTGDEQGLNEFASQMTKTKVYGEALFCIHYNEAAAQPRIRYNDLTLSEFNNCFHKKRKRSHSEAQAMCLGDYKQIKTQMQGALNGVEEQISSSAQHPHALAHAAVRPSLTGKELRQIVEEVYGHKYPEKRPVQPPEHESEAFWLQRLRRDLELV